LKALDADVFRVTPIAGHASILLLLAFGLLSNVVAQTGGTLSGRVLDPTGGGLPGVVVTAVHLETDFTRSLVTEGNGRYLFSLMPAGRYELSASLPGFRPIVHRGLALTVRESVVVDLVLRVGDLEQEITVFGETPMTNMRSGELSYLVSEGAIRDLPLNGRNYTDLALLQPGVLAYRQRDGGSVVAYGLAMSINGQEPRSNVYLLDGTMVNNFTGGPAGSAAGTALGMETIREFRVESNAYSAEFGRNPGGQVNVLTKSGGNEVFGSLFHLHRNSALDARNFFDPEGQPPFRRNQFGATVGGPIRKGRSFYFLGYEGLRERKGRTIRTVVPNLQAREGQLPHPTIPGETMNVGVDPTVAPYLDAFPLPNGADLGGGLAAHAFGFNEEINQHFFQGRYDRNVGLDGQVFARYTFDDAEQWLPTDYPRFPRAFVSRNQFLTSEYRHVASPGTLHSFRGGVSRTRIGQEVEAQLDSPLGPFVPGRPTLGNIDIGGMPRFGPQTSADVSLIQNLFGLEYGTVHHRGRHALKAGALVERYQNNMVNPTFSRGIFTFPNLQAFLENRPLRFLGLTPEGALDRHWRWTLLGFYLQNDFQAHSRVALNLGLRWEYATLPKDLQGRDSTMINLTDPEPTTGQLYRGTSKTNLSPRLGLAWDLFGDGQTILRSGYGLFFSTNIQQHLIPTFSNPPATPRIVIPNPVFPVPPFERGIGNSIRPVDWELESPRVHVWNLNLQRALPGDFLLTTGYAGSRGRRLLRSGDLNVPQPARLDDGTYYYPPGLSRPNPAFTTIEMKTSDGDSWYNALVLELRKRWTSGFNLQSSYTLSRNIDTTQGSTFFSDATTGTVSAFPEPPGLDYNKGLADFHAKHSWVVNFTWDVPAFRDRRGLAGTLLGGWQLAGIGQLRSGNPLTLFVQENRSRSLWFPSLGPGLGFDRPSMAPGRTHQDAVLGGPDRYFDPTAFVLQPRGTLGDLGRGALIGPNLRTLDLAAIKHTRWAAVGEKVDIQFRVEAFNVLNRANFGPPGLQAFAGTADQEEPLPALGRIRSTVTDARQIQVGLRILF
jgi:hypothetical protein